MQKMTLEKMNEYKKKPICVTIPEPLIMALDATAKKEKMNRSQFITGLIFTNCKHNLKKQEPLKTLPLFPLM